MENSLCLRGFEAFRGREAESWLRTGGGVLASAAGTQAEMLARKLQKVLESQEMPQPKLPWFFLRSSCVSAVQCGLYVASDCVFQDQCMGGRCPLGNFVHPAVLCGSVLSYPCSKDKIIYFPMGFSGVLIAVISEHFTNSNLILQSPLGREDSSLVQHGLKRIFLIELDFYFL